MSQSRLTESELREGIVLCKRKIKKLLDDAEILLFNNGDIIHALGLYTFAVEEYGKLVHMTTSQKKDDGNYYLDGDIFRGHPKKFELAFTNLPNECKFVFALIASGLDRARTVKFGNTRFSITGIGGVAKSIDFDIRMECFYVDWDKESRHWNFEPILETTELAIAIDTLKSLPNMS